MEPNPYEAPREAAEPQGRPAQQPQQFSIVRVGAALLILYALLLACQFWAGVEVGVRSRIGVIASPMFRFTIRDVLWFVYRRDSAVVP